MKKLLPFLLLFLATPILYGQQRPIGVNLSDLSNFASQLVYVDVMHQSSTWQVMPLDESVFHIEGAVVPQGPDGYPTQVPFDWQGEMVRPHVTVLNAQPEPFLYPAGDYTLIFEGTGEVLVRWDVVGGEFRATAPNEQHSITVSPTTMGLNLIIMQSDPADPIRNIRLIMPGFEDSYQDQPFHPDFLALLEPFEAIRFMKPLAVEENTLSHWEDRTEVDHYTYVTDETEQIRFHMPYEHVIQIANSLNKDIWINVPPFANDEYVEEMAALFAAGLNDGIHLYIEFSNESWNLLYPVTRQYMIDQGRAMGLGQDETEANVRYHAFRSFRIWDEFKSAFAERSGQIREVLGSQSFVDVGRISIDAIKDPVINPAGTVPYSIAVASYMGIELIDELIADRGECGFDGDDILDRLEVIASNEISEYMEQFEFWADSAQIQVVAYEGGQHLSVGNFGLNSDCVAEAIAAANRSSRMRDLFCTYFDLWFDEYGGGLFMSFKLAESYGLGGSFGILESSLQNPAESAKWQAHVDCAFIGEPELSIVGSLNFGAIGIGESASAQLTLRNTGMALLEITALEFPFSVFSSDWQAGTIEVNGQRVVSISFNPEEAINYSGDLRIVSNAGVQSVQVSAIGELVTSLDLAQPLRQVKIYPNPASTQLWLDLETIPGIVEVAWFNNSGLKVMGSTLSGGGIRPVNTTGLDAGLYILRMTLGPYQQTKKILIQSER